MADDHPPPEVVALAHERAVARQRRDFAAADVLRDRIFARGWTVSDGPAGWELTPVEPIVECVRPQDVPSVLDEPPTADASVHWVCDGWPEDIDRALAGFRAHHTGRRVQFVVADLTGRVADRWGSDVEVVSLVEEAGWAEACNAGLRRSRGELTLLLDGSIEPTGDVLTPLAHAFETRGLGIAGPFGLITHDLREFEETNTPGPVDAIEGYLVAVRRETVAATGGLDQSFRWYRHADIELSFRIRDLGLRAEVVKVPAARHEHRAWVATSEDDRARLSKRNFNRFLEHWRDRWDLVLAGEPGNRR